MEQITILIRDERKAKSLLDLLNSLDFVSVLDVEDIDETIGDVGEETSQDDAFFAGAGMWHGRDVTVESLRTVAWPRQT